MWRQRILPCLRLPPLSTDKRQVRFTAGRVIQTSKELGVTPQDVKVIRHATEKRRLRELILREHARQANLSLAKITAMRHMGGGQNDDSSPGAKPAGAPGSPQQGRRQDGAGVARGEGSASSGQIAPTDRRLQGITTKELDQHIEGLRKVSQAMAAAAGDFTVVRPTVGTRLLNGLFDD